MKEIQWATHNLSCTICHFQITNPLIREDNTTETFKATSLTRVRLHRPESDWKCVQPKPEWLIKMETNMVTMDFFYSSKVKISLKKNQPCDHKLTSKAEPSVI